MSFKENSTRSIAARAFFAFTAASTFVGIALELWLSYHSRTVLPPHAGFSGTFGPGLDGALNQLVFFTTQSNAILGVTTLLLALRLNRRSELFHVLRLVGMIDITITAAVYNVLLAGDVKPQGLGEVANFVQHMLNPALAWAGWLVFGPTRLVTLRRVGLATIVPLTWGGATLIRGALINWYPYSILDVPRLGYGGVALYILAILALFLVIAGVLALVDRWLGARPYRAGELTVPGPPAAVGTSRRQATFDSHEDTQRAASGRSAGRTQVSP